MDLSLIPILCDGDNAAKYEAIRVGRDLFTVDSLAWEYLLESGVKTMQKQICPVCGKPAYSSVFSDGWECPSCGAVVTEVK